MTVEADVLTRALNLPTKDRAEIARQLIVSLEPGEQEHNIDASWETEIEHRLMEVDKGETQLHEWRASIERIQRVLKQR